MDFHEGREGDKVRLVFSDQVVSNLLIVGFVM